MTRQGGEKIRDRINPLSGVKFQVKKIQACRYKHQYQINPLRLTVLTVSGRHSEKSEWVPMFSLEEG